MDSLTQLALGAAVGEAVAGRQVGRRAALWGAICGTLPLLIGVIAALVASRERRWGRNANIAGLVLSTCYLAWTVGAQWHVEQVARRALDAQGLTGTAVLSTPAPFNSVLWRVLGVNDTHYYEGFYSLLDGNAPLRFTRKPRRLDLIAPLANDWPVRRLQWFTKDFYAAALRERDIVITDLRMGMEPGYVFSFKVGVLGNPHALGVPVERVPAVRDWSRLRWVWQRIFDPHAR